LPLLLKRSRQMRETSGKYASLLWLIMSITEDIYASEKKIGGLGVKLILRCK
jgi:hypothetical protein